MSDKIIVDYGLRVRIMELFDTSYPTVRAALNGSDSTEFRRRIRRYALMNGGIRVISAGESDAGEDTRVPTMDTRVNTNPLNVALASNAGEDTRVPTMDARVNTNPLNVALASNAGEDTRVPTRGAGVPM